MTDVGGRAAQASEPRAAQRHLPAAAWVGVLTVTGAALRLFEIGEQALWHDEAYTYLFSTAPLGRILSLGQPIDPGNPSLYYALIHGWMALAGSSDIALRLPSVLFGVLIIPASYHLGREIGGARLGLAVAALTAASAINMEFSQLARGYTLLALAATVAMWGLAHLLAERAGAARPIGSSLMTSRASDDAGGWRTDLAWAAVVGGSGVAVLTHDTAVLLVAGLNIVVVATWLSERRPRDRFFSNWLKAQIALIILWGPWIPNFLSQSAAVYERFWIPPTRAYDVAYAFKQVVSGWSPTLIGRIGLILGGSLAVVGLLSWRGRDRRWYLFVATMVLVLPLGELLVSIWRPILLVRTWIWVAVPVSVAVAAGALRLPRPWRGLALSTMIALSLSGYVNHQLRYEIPEWDLAVQDIVSEAQPGDVVVTGDIGSKVIVERYLGVEFGEKSEREVIAVNDAGDVAEAVAGHDRVWTVVCRSPCLDISITETFDAPSGLGSGWVAIERLAPHGLEVHLFTSG